MWHYAAIFLLVLASFISQLDCLYDKCTAYHPPPSSCFSFPLCFIAFIFLFFFSNFCGALFNPSTPLLSNVSDMDQPIYVAFSLYIFIRVCVYINTYMYTIVFIFHAFGLFDKHSEVWCEEEETFTPSGGVTGGNWAKRNRRHGCEHWGGGRSGAEMDGPHL